MQKPCKSLWLDIDCGGPGKDTEIEQSTGPYLKATLDKKEGQGYKGSQKVLLGSLLDLPPPTIVDSGNGWHLYWAFTEEVPRDQWIPLADRP